ncbi:MAG: 30S ribosomal protein S6 [Promicromonosporaceae bacterium]|nr:30S ribosomal protein S6 [Promicromonosporaceae bacterium]
MMMILDPEVEERTITQTIEKLLAVIPATGGTVDNVDVWGRRQMTFDINKRSQGLYAVVDFTATSDTAKELERQLSLNEMVLRTKIMRKETPYAQRKAE